MLIGFGLPGGVACCSGGTGFVVPWLEAAGFLLVFAIIEFRLSGPPSPTEVSVGCPGDWLTVFDARQQSCDKSRAESDVSW